MSFTIVVVAGVPGLTRSATRTASGRSCRMISNRFDASSTLNVETPVTLPPGRLRLVTSPTATGSAPVVKTIGMLVVAAFAASGEGSALLCGYDLHVSLARSAARAVNRSYCPCANRYSMVTSRPSTNPASRSPSRKALMRIEASRRSAVKETDHRNRCLLTPRQRPRSRRTTQRNELPPSPSISHRPERADYQISC